MTKTTKTRNKKSAPEHPHGVLTILAAIGIASVVAVSIHIFFDALNAFQNAPQVHVIVMLEWAEILAAILPILIGVITFFRTKGSWHRKLVGAAIFMGIYWIAQSLFSAYVPTFDIITHFAGEGYRDTGINFFIEHVVGLIAVTVAYFIVRKRTIHFNPKVTGIFLVIIDALTVMAVYGYFFLH